MYTSPSSDPEMTSWSFDANELRIRFLEVFWWPVYRYMFRCYVAKGMDQL